MNTACGSLCVAISQRFDTIGEFTTFEDFVSYERKGKNKIKRVENHKIKVTIEVDMVLYYRNIKVKLLIVQRCLLVTYKARLGVFYKKTSHVECVSVLELKI